MQVMIVDFDVHHGNGTQDAFYNDPSVLFVDMHEDGVWPGSGKAKETGTGPGTGATINIPLPGVVPHLRLASLLHKQRMLLMHTSLEK